MSNDSQATVASEISANVDTQLTRDLVIQCYKNILKRDPESETAIQNHLSATSSFWGLIDRFIYSSEFKKKIGYAKATRHDVIQCYKRILKREPESEATIQHHLSGRTTLWDLVSRMVDSEEHKTYVVNISAMSLLKCIGRKYLANSIRDRDRYICFFHHYAYLAEAMSANAFQNMLLKHVRIFSWSGGRNDYTVNLQSNRELDNEGEVILEFQAGSVTIYSITFSIVPGRVLGAAEERNVILISRMQGKAGRFQEIRLATKEMGEIAPRAILIAVLQGIALAIGIRRVAGVSATNQLSFEKREAELLERAYDQYFRSIGANGPSDGFYFFEVPLLEKPIGLGHRGRKQLKREFKKEITDATRIVWRDTIGLKRGEAAPAQVLAESEKPPVDQT